MLNQAKVNEEFRKRIVKVFLYAAVVVFLMEAFVGVMFWKTGQIDSTSVWKYVYIRTLLPTCLNFSMLFLSYFLNENDHVDDKIKQSAVVISVFGFSTVAIIFHSFYTGIICAILIPVMVAVMLCNKKLFKISLGLSVVGSIVHLLIQEYDYLNATVDYIVCNFFVICIILVAVYFVGMAFIDTFNDALLLIENEFEKVKKENWAVVHDESTGLYNSLVLSVKVKENIKQYKENKIKNLCVAFFELDNLNDINSTYGVDVGTTIMKLFASILNSKMNENVLIAKYENDKFFMLVNEKALNDVVELFKSIKDEIYNNDNVMVSEGKLTFATGIVEYDGVASDEELLSNCLKALDQAKENGKNQTAIVR